MSKFKCEECGSDLIVEYTTPNKHYEISDNDFMKRCDTHSGPGWDDPTFNVICSEDKEHNIGETKDKLEWITSLEEKFREEGLYDT